jgi:hypothetical protein
MTNKLLRIAQVGFVLAMTSLVVASASAAGNPQVPTIMPADPNSIPAHEQITKLISLILALFVVGLVVTIISCLWAIINSLRGGNGLANGAFGALVAAVIVLGLTITQGTGYLTAWTGFFT